jgi:putative ABC transport system permease protein
MFKNYLKIAFRTLWRSKGFSLLNLTGLAVGMASAILILLWIHNESGYDSFHKNKDHIYMVWNRGISSGKLECWPTTPRILGPTLLKDFPGIAGMARTEDRWFVTAVGEKKASSHAMMTDSGFLSIFSFPMLEGNPATALNSPNSIVLTESMAKKFFGKDDAMNRTVEIDKSRFTVTGILKDLPTNTYYNFEFLLPWSYEKAIGSDDANWGNNSINTVVLLRPGTTEAGLDAQIKDFTSRHTKGVESGEQFLHPLSKWHLYDQFENGKNTGGFITAVRLFGVIAAFILLVACINFMNLSTARSERRAREVGIRKVAGAYRSLLIGQFLGESILMSFISGVLALLLVQIALPAFDTLVTKQLVLPYTDPFFWAFFLLFILATGILAGSYPAFFLSSFRPVSVLKGTFKRAHAAINPRKVLVVLQFSFAILLIISTLIVVQQIRYAQDRAMGYDRNRIVYHWATGALNRKYPLLRSELLASGVTTSVSRTGSPLTLLMSRSISILWTGKPADDKTLFDILSEDEGLGRTAGLKFVQGRDMDLAQYPTDSTAILLNESAVRAMGFKTPIGQTVTDNQISFHVVGVIKDFLMGSPYDAIQPMVIEGIKSDYFNVINMRLADGQRTAQSLETIRKIFQKYNPDYPFEYHFTNDDYALKFAYTQSVATLTGLFAGLTIFISCLGLFGLAAYMAEARVREIGIRKVLGASVLSITSLLTKEFVTLVVLSFVIASPIAWIAMTNWLQGYDYRIHISGWIFLLAGGLSVLVSLLTVGYQALAAARANPAKSLRP